MVTSVSSTSSPTTTSSGKTTNDAASMQDRFLKLLVAQINNQDPLNPMDNAQMTTQMAQINTVNGIQQVNETLQGMASQFASMQVLQAASLVGHEVLLPGSTLTRDATTGTVGSAFDLGGNASQVKIEILSPVGDVLGTLNSSAMPPGAISSAGRLGLRELHQPELPHHRRQRTAERGSDALHHRQGACRGRLQRLGVG